ncbi:MAG: AAA ATPase [Geoglossum umbratile]|nr:MAG: AAA ATPase [Geoglossum umbratile]
MASSVLGKRTRSSGTSGNYLGTLESLSGFDADLAWAASISGSPPRVRRRTRASIYADENDDPFVARAGKKTAQDGDVMQVDDVEDELLFKSPRKAPREAKDTITVARIPLSPKKINTHFKVTKPVLDENTNVSLIATPQTPRRRDALSKKQPVTPRHRVTVASKFFTPRTPRTPTTPRSTLPTVYARARQLFVRSANPGRLVGRSEERNELNSFIRTRIESKSGGCIYVSGPPGTGKSALVTEIVADYAGQDSVKTAYINCMSVKSSGDIFSKILADLCVDSDGLEGNESKILQGMFMPRGKSAGGAYVVTLDEIDHLLTLDLEILYTVFEWSLHRYSRLILIGIANALDLTDRFLPRLKARKLKPQLLPFLPYTAPQIASIITTRLQSLLPEQGEDYNTAKDHVPFLHPAAINLCSKKVASQTGDLRKAFDICRRAIDLIESETKQKHQEELNDQAFMFSPSKTPLVENMNLSSSPSISPRKSHSPAKRASLPASLANLTPETAPRASIGHIARISSATFGNGSEQRLKSLNLQQKAALCALIAHEKRLRTAALALPCTPSKSARSKSVTAPSIRTLYETYVSLCKRDKVLHPLTSTEFRDVISSLEALSLVTILDGSSSGGGLGLLGTPSKRGRAGLFGKGGDETRVGSCVGEGDVEAAVEGTGSQILRAILRDGGLE